MPTNMTRFALSVPVVVIFMAAAIATAQGQIVPAPFGAPGMRGHVVDLNVPCGRRIEVRAIVKFFSRRGSYGTSRVPVMAGRYTIYVDGRRLIRGQFNTLRNLRSGERLIGTRIHRIPPGRRCRAVVNFNNAQTVQRRAGCPQHRCLGVPKVHETPLDAFLDAALQSLRPSLMSGGSDGSEDAAPARTWGMTP